MILAGVGVDWVLFLGLDLNNSVGLGHNIQYHSLLTAVPQKRLRTGGPKSRWELPDYMVTIPQFASELFKSFVGEEHCYWLRDLRIINYFEKQFFDCLWSGLVLMEIALAECKKITRHPVDMRHPHLYNIIFNHLIDSRWSFVLITRSTVFLVGYNMSVLAEARVVHKLFLFLANNWGSLFF